MTFTEYIPTILCGVFMVVTLASHLYTRRVVRTEQAEWDRRSRIELAALTNRHVDDLQGVLDRTQKTLAKPAAQTTNGHRRTEVAA